MADYYIYDSTSLIVAGAYRNRLTAPVPEAGQTRVEVAYASPSMVGHVYHVDGIHHRVAGLTPEGVLRDIYIPAHRTWFGQLRDAADSYPQPVRDLGRNKLYWSMGGNYLVQNNAAIPLADRISHMLYSAQGAADTSNADQFFQKAETLVASTGPISWVDQSDYRTRLNLAAAVSIAGTLPSGLVLLNPSWGASIPAYNPA